MEKSKKKTSSNNCIIKVTNLYNIHKLIRRQEKIEERRIKNEKKTKDLYYT